MYNRLLNKVIHHAKTLETERGTASGTYAVRYTACVEYTHAHNYKMGSHENSNFANRQLYEILNLEPPRYCDHLYV